MNLINILIVAVMLFLSACSSPVPKDKLDYVGEWKSKEMVLLIMKDGTVAYKRFRNGGSTSVNGPIQEFRGDNFVVGFGPISTTFKVSEPPQEVDGVWQMVVDGVRVSKVSE